jgi:hypothetical protein
MSKPIEGVFYFRGESTPSDISTAIPFYATSKAVLRKGRDRSYRLALSAEPKNGPFEFRLLSDDVSPGGLAAIDLRVDAGVLSDRAGSIGDVSYAIAWTRIPRLQAGRK